MFFYFTEKETVIKYNISLNEEGLKRLRSEIIERCSEIKHIKEITINLPNKYDYEHIKNYSEKFIRKVDKDDFYGTVYDEYLVEYDYYKHPKLVVLIDELLKGNSSVISEIINPQIENKNEEKIIMNEQKDIIKLLNNNKNNDIEKQLKLLKEHQKKLVDYKIKKELNKNQISVEPYHQKVFNYIDFNEINRISLKSILDVQEFLLDSNIKTLDKDLNKILKINIIQKK